MARSLQLPRRRSTGLQGNPRYQAENLRRYLAAKHHCVSPVPDGAAPAGKVEGSAALAGQTVTAESTVPYQELPLANPGLVKRRCDDERGAWDEVRSWVDGAGRDDGQPIELRRPPQGLGRRGQTTHKACVGATTRESVTLTERRDNDDRHNRGHCVQRRRRPRH